MSHKTEREMISPRSMAVRALMFATALVAIGVLILGLLVSPLFYLLFLAVAVLALVPLKAPSAPRPLVVLTLAPVLFFSAVALFLGFALHPGFFLLLLVLVIFIGLARLLAEPPAQLDEQEKDAAG